MRDLQKAYSERWTTRSGRTNNEVVRRITTVAAVILAGLVFTSTAYALPPLPADCQCGALVANGRGWVGNWATGNVWGSLGSGTIWIRDRDGKGRFLVSHYSSKMWDSSARAWRFKGSKMRFQAWGRWWVKVQGTGIAESATAQGTAHLKGTGKYYLNGGRARAWPGSPRQLLLRD